MQTMKDSIQMHTPKGECLVNRLLNHIRRIVGMKLQDTNKFLYSSAFRPFLLENGKHFVVGLRPFFAPLFHGGGIVKRAWPLFKKRDVVERIENILLAAIAAQMGS